MLQTDPALETWLNAFLAQKGASAGTVHLLRGDALCLRAAVNIAVCNIKTDGSGDVRPGAKAVGAQAALAIPVRDPDGTVCAGVGIAFLGEREFAESELLRFEAQAAILEVR